MDLEAAVRADDDHQAVEPREIRVLPRGNWMDNSGQVVQPQYATLYAASSTTGDGRPTRLDLAKWLVSRNHPLTARVVVNRLWKLYFGIGLSKVLIDLGSRGECAAESGTAGLAGDRVHGQRLGHEARDGLMVHVQRLSAVVVAAAGSGARLIRTTGLWPGNRDSA